MRLDDKTIVITGSSRGLGLAIAKAVVQAGATVCALNRRITDQQEWCEPDRYRSFVCDVRDVDEVNSAVVAVLDWQPRIDILINNAGVWTDNNAEQHDPLRRKLAFETNSLGPIHLTNALLPVFKQQDSGHIFNVISAAGDALSPSADNRDWHTYGATKWAMTGFTKALRDSLAGTNIKVSGFFPGGMNTDFFEATAPEGQAHDQWWMMRTEDVADVVLFALTRPDDVLVESLTLTKFAQPPVELP